MLGYFLSTVLHLWGLPEWQKVPPEVLPQIGNAVSEYSRLVENEEPFFDILGPVYMSLRGKGSKQSLGQHFTPWNLAQMMTVMIAGDRPSTPNDRLIRVCDPTCGAGVMLLSYLNMAFHNWGAESLKGISVTGCDLDPYVARIAAVQILANCSLHQLLLGEVVVLRGDSLSPWTGMETIAFATAPGTCAPSAQEPTRLKAIAEAAKSQLYRSQLTLFGEAA